MTDLQERVARATVVLDNLGAAYRGDWNDFDGRTLLYQLNKVTAYLAGDSDTLDDWTHDGHWEKYCADLYECETVKEDA